MSSLAPGTEAARAALVALGRRYFALGWLFATAGNLSARIGDRVVVTASGKHKGDLTPTDFVEVDLEGRLLTSGSAEQRASAETAIHLAIYRTQPAARVCLHVHTVASTLVHADPATVPNAEDGPPTLNFAGLEMVKALDIWDVDGVARLPVFPNHHDVLSIAADVERYYRADTTSTPALLIAGHGITAWGPDAFSANRHVEATEFLCQIQRARMSGRPNRS